MIAFTWEHLKAYLDWASDQPGIDTPYIYGDANDALSIDGRIDKQSLEEWIAHKEAS